MYWELASISPIINQRGEITHYLAIKEDITDKKIIEEELRVAKDKAEESDRLKSEFLAQLISPNRTRAKRKQGAERFLFVNRLGR